MSDENPFEGLTDQEAGELLAKTSNGGVDTDRVAPDDDVDDEEGSE